jgi:hypothetical protein
LEGHCLIRVAAGDLWFSPAFGASASRFWSPKFAFPRGDATSLMLGFDAAGEITGIAVGGIAGD